ncbi:MAG: glycosyltransferase family 1 protein [Chloroflexi bacterium]|nr:glycosyltransferase family 1 protein [Chloroflexota bacterium]
MKVGIFLDEYNPEDGGAHTFQNEVLDSLIRLTLESQHEFVLITSHPNELGERISGTDLAVLAYRKPGLIEKVWAFTARNWPNWRKSRKWSSGLELIARRAGVQFVWFLSPRPKPMDLPFMTIVLDLQHRLQPWFPEVSRWGEWEIRQRGLARFLPRAAAILAGTQAGKEEIARFYRVPEERIHILPHPTPAFALRAGEAESTPALSHLGLPESYLLYPAQFWPHKNHVNLLLALKELRAADKFTPGLVLVGSDFGNQEFIREQVQALGLADQVHILGFVSQDELVALYQNALALTYVSFFGPENLPPLEAMALGCPVIAADVSGAQEQMGDAALLVPPDKPKDIAAAIRKLVNDDMLRIGLVQRGRKRAASWTTDDFVRSALGILDEFEPIRRVWRE